VCAATFVRGARQGPVRRWHGPGFAPTPSVDGADIGTRPTWSHLVADTAAIPHVRLETSERLGDRAGATADFRDQYYGLIGAVADEADGPALVTSGLIEPGRCEWGQRPVRFARATYEAPRVALDRLDAPLQLWAKRRLVPKVLVAMQTRVIEAVVDADGAWLPSVPVVTVVPHDAGDLWHVGAVLCAPAVSAWAASTYLGVALAPTAIKLSARQVLEVPLPNRSWDDAATALRAGDVDACGRAMDRAYGTDVYAWWRERIVSRRSR
jgi:hypothetical protein